MMPPPNVTGSLHMGHALTFTLQDILIRFSACAARRAVAARHRPCRHRHRDRRSNGNWPRRQINKHDLGRDDFIERVWAWKAESGGTITRQLRRLGASADWGRERFTMDEGLSGRSPRSSSRSTAGADLPRQAAGQLGPHDAHRDLRPRGRRAREAKGHLWHIRYPIEGEPARFLVVATTRPETMLGDTAVAVHPEDARYTDLSASTSSCRWSAAASRSWPTNMPTPKRAAARSRSPRRTTSTTSRSAGGTLEMINIFDRTRRSTTTRSRKPIAAWTASRRASSVVADLEAAGTGREDRDHTLTCCPMATARAMIIEPWLTDQWYCNAATLAKPAIKAVERAAPVFVPKQWENTYLRVDAQHPALVHLPPDRGGATRSRHGTARTARFSSTKREDEASGGGGGALRRADRTRPATRTCSTPGSHRRCGRSRRWAGPSRPTELERYYPGDVLVTGFDIIFFWVARMMMMGLHFMGDVPFRTVYIHALVRDERGQKMSKSKGNIIDPLELIDRYGCDALRFTLAAMAAQGRDIKLAVGRVEGYTQFRDQAVERGALLPDERCVAQPGFDPRGCKLTVNRWIVGEVAKASARVAEALEAYRFNDAAGRLVPVHLEHFLRLVSGVHQADPERRRRGGQGRDAGHHRLGAGRILQLLHPFMPFITEELWEKFGTNRENGLIRASWPEFSPDIADASAQAEMDWVVRLISTVRGVRSEMNVPAGAQIPLLLKDASPETVRRLDTYRDIILRMARLSSVDTTAEAAPKGAIQAVLDEATVVLPLAGVIDLDQEKARLSKEIDKLTGEITKIDQKLNNANFVSRAPEEVIEEQRDRRATAEAAKQKLAEALARLSST